MDVPGGTYVEVWRDRERTVVALDGARTTIGRDAENTISVASDASCSRAHAVLEPVGGSWCVRDLGSRNGTFLNGDRLWGERALRSGDEVRIGRTRIVFHAQSETQTRTETIQAAPKLTPRERDVLIALCHPLLAGNLFTEPATIREIADGLTVTETAVKQHIGRLYDKFGLYGTEERRRARLANEAVRRAAVTLADLISPE